MSEQDYIKDPYIQALAATQQFYQILTEESLQDALNYASVIASQTVELPTTLLSFEEQDEASKRKALFTLYSANAQAMGGEKVDLPQQAYQGLAQWANSWKAMIEHDKKPHSLPSDYQLVIASMQKKVRQEPMSGQEEYLVEKYNHQEALCQKLQAYAYGQVPARERKDRAYQESYKAQQQKGYDSLRNRLLDESENRNQCIELIKEILIYCYRTPIQYKTCDGERMVAELRVKIHQHFDARCTLTARYSAADLIKAKIVSNAEETKRQTHSYYPIYQRLEAHYKSKGKGQDTFEAYLDSRIRKYWCKIANDFYSIIGTYAGDKEIESLQEQLKIIEGAAAIVNMVGLIAGLLCIASGLLVYHQLFFPLASAGGTLILLTIGSILAESLPYLMVYDDNKPIDAGQLGANSHDLELTTSSYVNNCTEETRKSHTPPSSNL